VYSKREFLDYLNDILESVRDIQDFTSNVTYDEFVKDKKTLKAVIRCFEVIGEAAKAVPLDIREDTTMCHGMRLLECVTNSSTSISGLIRRFSGNRFEMI
jgi:uncharacterized protein with HEPN domain